MTAQPTVENPFNDLPEGTVTFLFSDIVGSTKLLYQLGDQFTEVLAEHHRILREAVAHYRGQVVRTEGDAFFVAFPRATDAVAAAVEAQRGLAQHPWPEGADMRVRLVSAGAGGKARVWGTAQDNMVLSLPYGYVSLADWSPDGEHMALGIGSGPEKASQGMVAVWDMNTGQPQFETSVDKDATFTWMAGYSPDGEYILAKTILNWPETSDANKYYLLNSQNGEIVRLLESGEETILLIPGWSPDGRLVGGGDWEGKVYFWEASSGELVRKLNCLSWGHIVQWSPDGKKIAMMCLDFSEEVGIIQVMDAKTYEPLVTIDGDLTNGCFQYFRWSPDSNGIVAGCGSDETGTTTNPIYIFDANSGEELLKIVRHTGAVAGVGWSPDGKRIVSGSTDDTTRIWDAETGAELLTLSTPGDWFVIPEWSPDGQYLRVDIDGNFPGRNGVWRVWQTKEELIEYAKECCVFRELTDAEREQFGLTER